MKKIWRILFALFIFHNPTVSAAQEIKIEASYDEIQIIFRRLKLSPQQILSGVQKILGCQASLPLLRIHPLPNRFAVAKKFIIFQRVVRVQQFKIVVQNGMVGFYVHTTKTVYFSLPDLCDAVLAHEFTHFVLSEIRVPEDEQEPRAKAVEALFRKAQ